MLSLSYKLLAQFSNSIYWGNSIMVYSNLDQKYEIQYGKELQNNNLLIVKFGTGKFLTYI